MTRQCERDDGAAIIEFCFLGLLLLVPIAYVVITAFSVQAASYAVAAATREAGRAFATTVDGEPQLRATQAAAVAMSDHGLDLAPGALAVRCTAEPCLTPGAVLHTTMTVQVPLPLLPDVLAGAVPASIRVEGTHVEYVDRFRSGR